MRRQSAVVIALIGLIFLLSSMPAMAEVYKYTGTSFRHIGFIFHQKEISFSGGEISFLIQGHGMVEGSHDVHIVERRDVEYIKNNNNNNNDENNNNENDNDEEVVPRVIDFQEKLNMSLRFTGTTDPNASEDDKLIMLTSIELYNRAKLNTGVEMDPGETGYIRQDIASNSTPEGDYLKINNRFGNTGGTTKREIEVKGFMNEIMRVDGSAEVWESTRVRNGGARTGFWDVGP